MRIKSLLAILIMAAFSTTAFAQELTLKYGIEMSSDNPQVKAQIGMMQGSTLTLFSKDGKFRQVMSLGSDLAKTTTIMNSDTKKGVLLIEGMAGKIAAPFNLEEFDQSSNDSDVKVELMEDTKTILGYTCKKAVLTTKSGHKATYWYTKDIKTIKNATRGEYIPKQIPGMPLEFSLSQPNIDMTFTATNIEHKVTGDNLFDTSVPSGYTEKSLDEIQKMMGGQ